MEYELSIRANKDLQQIYDYIAKDSQIEANKLINSVYETCGFLARFPYSGNQRIKYSKKPLRSIPVRKKYIIMYDPNSRPIKIERVIHSSRNIARVISDS